MTSPPSPSCTIAPRGPGLLEAIGWTVGYLVLQLLTALGLVGLLIYCAFEGWPAQNERVFEILARMEDADITWLSVYVSGGATLGGLFFIIPAVGLRLRPKPRDLLGTHLPDRRQLVLLTGAVLPLGILAAEVYRAATVAWEQMRTQFSDAWPMLAEFGQVDTMDFVQHQTALTSYPLLLVIVGVGPAIGEELVFRGVIGRGLINRVGVVWGVLLTSLLFGLAHGTPAHAIATLPLAVFLHVVYLTTGTIWAPIIVHFLNNALSVTMMKYGMGELGAHVSVSWSLIVSSVMYVVAMSALLWSLNDHQTRDAFPLARPAFPQTPPVSFATALAVPTSPWLWASTTLGVVAFTWTFVAAAFAGT